MFEIGKLPSLDLGYQGENKVRTIDIDMTAWLEEYPGSKVALMVKRPDEDVYYPAGKMEGNVLLWVIDRADRQYAGRGEAQVILKGADDIEQRTRVVKTKISPSLSGTEVEAPPPYATWVGDVLDAAAQAEAAVKKMPTIGENGNWYNWDAAAGTHVDTGKPSRGEQGIQGNQGPAGPAGKAGSDGAPGAAGKDGTSVTVSSVSESTADGGTNVVTFSDGKKLNVRNGSKGSQGNPGYTPRKGVDYRDGVDGKNGADGKTPVRGVDYWTEEDKQSIVDEVLAEIPEGGLGENVTEETNTYTQLLADLEKAVEDLPDDVGFETDATLTLKNGILSVNTADVVEEDNTLPVTSAAVFAEVGNINALLGTI